MDNKLIGLIVIVAIVGIALVGDGGFSGDLFATVPACPVASVEVSATANTALIFNSKLTKLSQGDKINIKPGTLVYSIVNFGDAKYYGDNIKFVVPCKDKYTLTGNKWEKDSFLTLRVYDEFDNMQDGTRNIATQEIGVRDTVKMKYSIQGNYKKYYGNPDVPGDDVLVFEYNKKEISQITLTDKSGKKMSATSVPVMYSLKSTENKAVAFKVPKIAGNMYVDYFVTITSGYTKPVHDIESTLFDIDWYPKLSYGKYLLTSGYEDMNHDDIGITAEPTVTIYVK